MLWATVKTVKESSIPGYGIGDLISSWWLRRRQKCICVLTLVTKINAAELRRERDMDAKALNSSRAVRQRRITSQQSPGIDLYII
jgi:hypothetical protein